MGHIERVKVGENSPQGDDMMWIHPREREEKEQTDSLEM
jgi:hypothetical protein